jgi:hypothetical protein
MKKALSILILALFVFALAACNLFFDPKTIRYSVTSTSAVNRPGPTGATPSR